MEIFTFRPAAAAAAVEAAVQLWTNWNIQRLVSQMKASPFTESPDDVTLRTGTAEMFQPSVETVANSRHFVRRRRRRRKRTLAQVVVMTSADRTSISRISWIARIAARRRPQFSCTVQIFHNLVAVLHLSQHLFDRMSRTLVVIGGVVEIARRHARHLNYYQYQLGEEKNKTKDWSIDRYDDVTTGREEMQIIKSAK